VLFLHRLQQRRLGARAGAVDFVGHQQLGEDRALDEAERAAASLAFLKHFGTQDVGRHEVGRALQALFLEAEHDAQRFHQLRLGEARHADEQQVTPAEQRDKGLVDNFGLSEDHPTDAFAHLAQALTKSFDPGNDVGGGGGRIGEFRLGSAQCNLSRLNHFSIGHDRRFVRSCRLRAATSFPTVPTGADGL